MLHLPEGQQWSETFNNMYLTQPDGCVSGVSCSSCESWPICATDIRVACSQLVAAVSIVLQYLRIKHTHQVLKQLTHTHTHTHSHTSVGGANGAPVRHAVKRGPTLQANISATKQDIDMVLSDKQTSDNPEVNGLVYSRFLNYGKIM